MLPAQKLTDSDTLREVASIGFGRAVSALGRLTGRTAGMDVPEARLADPAGDLSDLLDPLGGAVFAVGVELGGFLGGHLALALPEPDARRLSGLLGQPVGEAGWDPVAESAILEAGNIVGSAFVSAVGRLTGTTLLLSVPRLARGSGRDCLAALRDEVAGGVALATRFSLSAAEREPEGISGLVLAVPDPARLDDLLAALPGY
jgi:chemotaxis protein CheC